MYLLKLTELFRRVFANRSVIELPALPAPLAEPWCHPDIYMSIADRGVGSCFTFQIPEAAADFLVDRSLCCPDLFWFTGLHTQDFLSCVTGFLAEIQKELFPDNCNAVFSISADPRRKFLPVEQGVGWKIHLAGVECGRLSVYAAIPGVVLADNIAVVLSLSLKTLACLAETIQERREFEWSAGIAASRLAVLHAWQNCNLTAENLPLREALEQKILPGDILPEAAICRLLSFFSLHAAQLRADNELMQQVAAKLGNALQRVTESIRPAGVV